MHRRVHASITSSVYLFRNETRNCLVRVGLATAATLALVGSAYAQFDAAEVLGTIRDSSGAVVPGATVTLSNVKQGREERRVADANGNFDFPGVQIGDYTVSSQKDGFAVSTSAVFHLQVAARQRIDLLMQAGQASETVTVTAAATQLDRDSSDRGEVIGHREAVDLPLDGRVTTDLAALVPGVNLNGQLDTGLPGGREASYNVNGLRTTANNFLLDGLDNNYYAPQNQGFNSQVIRPSPDATEEFKVQTSNYSAEYGRAGGAVLNVATRSGTNALHGVVYDYLRNTLLNAYGPFLGTGVKPTLIQNQFGATSGGRILRDRLFFFADYEGFRQISTAYTTSTLPTALQRRGIFTEGYTVPIRNPITGVTYANGVLPASAQSGFARAVLDALPANTVAGISNNYTTLARSTNAADKADLRLDYAQNASIQYFGRFTKQRFNIFSGPPFTGRAGGGGSGNQYGYNTQVAAGANWAVDAHSLLQARVAFTWTTSGKYPANAGQPSFVQQFGLPGLPAVYSKTPSLNVQAVTGFTAFGAQSSNPAVVDPYTINPKLSYTHDVGRHSLKAGYEYFALRLGYDDAYPQFGSDTYSGQFSKGTAAPSGASSSLTQQVYNLADFLVGARASYELAATKRFEYNQRFHYLYMQDDWRVSSALTLNLGLRYEFVTPPWVDGNQLANFDPSSKTLTHASAGSMFQRALVHPNVLNFAPRFGFAASVLPQTVLRGAYGISYVQGNRNGAEATLAYNTLADSVINQTTSQPLCANNLQDPFTCFLTTQQGYPDAFTSSQRYSAAGEYRYIPAHSPTGYVQSYHLTLQQSITPKLLLDVAYVGSHGVHLRVLQDYNQALPNPGPGSTACTSPVGTTGTPCATLSSRRPIAGYNSIIEPAPIGYITYNALQAKLRQTVKHGFFLLNSFTYSQAMDNAGAQYEVYNGDGAVVNTYNTAGDRGRAGTDLPINNTTSLNWEIPFGTQRNSGRGAPLLVRAVLGNWGVSLINQYTSGLPINLTYTPATSGTQTAVVSNASVAYSYRPNITGPVATVYVDPSAWVKTASSLSGVYSKANLAVPAYTQPFGNASRNLLRGPAAETVNLGVRRRFPLWREGTNLEFRGEAFNLLNSVNFRSPTANISSSSFGSYTASSAAPSRRLQVALRLSY